MLHKINRSVVMLCVLNVLFCVCSIDGSAQACTNSGTCQTNSLSWPCEPVPPPTNDGGFSPAPWEWMWFAKSSRCFDGKAKEACPWCATVGSPINLADGNTFIQQADVSVPGLGGGLRLTRTWISEWPESLNAARFGMFGVGWRSTYEESVFIGSDHYYKYARGDGSVWSFGYDSSLGETSSTASFKYLAASPANGGGGASLAITLTNSSASLSWPLTFGNGEQRLFDNNSGKLVGIIDRNGNKAQISYDSSGRMTTVTDAAGRHLYFNYANGGALVSSITSDLGITLSYSYDNQSRLVKVTKPDQSTINFEYDNNNMITAVKDAQGKILESHTYDSSGRGLSSSRANGVDALTISYPQ